MRVFLSHAHADAGFVLQVARHIRNSVDIYCYEGLPDARHSFAETLAVELVRSDAIVVFVGANVGSWQTNEVELALRLRGDRRACHHVVAVLRDEARLKGALEFLGAYPAVSAPTGTSPAQCAREIVQKLPDVAWRSDDDLPSNPHIFSLEKKIIEFFSGPRDLDNPEVREILKNGCPRDWPSVVHWTRDSPWTNQLSEDKIGKFRPGEAEVAAAALNTSRPMDTDPTRLAFPEAGPREKLFFPRPNRPLRAAVLVSGGIAPGINAVIDGITQRHWDYALAHGYQHNFNVIGLHGGFSGFETLAQQRPYLVPDSTPRAAGVTYIDTSVHANEAGSILGTARVEDLVNVDTRLDELNDCVQSLRGIDILYVIGGDGSMKGAHALWSVAQARGVQLSVVGIPKTMDNDILWVWQSFGFLSAVERARQVIEHLHTEISSNPRLCVIQLFGSDSGFVVSHAVAASQTGQCDLALIPEVPFSMRGVARWLQQRLHDRMHASQQHVPLGLVVLAETAIPTDVLDFIEGPEHLRVRSLTEPEKEAIRQFEAQRMQARRIEGQTTDALRTAGLKIVAEGLRLLLTRETQASNVDWKKLRIFTSEPRHLLRAVPPSTSDIIVGQRLGMLAVDNALAGYTDFMMSYWLSEYVLVPLKLVVLGRKRIPPEGIFWRSVLAKTKQPSDLVAPWSAPTNVARRPVKRRTKVKHR